jgi:hypothetical protein
MSESQDQTLQNSSIQNGQGEPSNTIKFSLHPDGEIECNNYVSGNTDFTSLPLLFGFALNKSTKADASACWYDYHTDLDGLKLLQSKSGDTVVMLSGALASLGMAMAYLNKEVGENHIRELYWLIAGLGDLLTLISRESSEITHAINVLSRQVGVDGGAK